MLGGGLAYDGFFRPNRPILPEKPMPAPLNIRRIDTRRGEVETALAELRERLSPRGDVVSEAGRQRTIDTFGEPLSPRQVVERICGEVADEGLPAVLRYCEKLDGAKIAPEELRVPESELAAAHAAADAEFLSTVRKVRENVLEFQSALLSQDVEVVRSGGVRLKHRYLPLRRAGLCVPGGAAAYPSTVLMTAVPAQAAGVAELAVVAPPTKYGAYNPVILATCHELGIREVYRMGGAQAVAALAYGVEGVPPVDKIVGPGNLFVALAKKHVYGEVDIDSIAGPSEVVVIADDTTRPEFAAADLLAQAEHAPGASILITTSDALLEATAAELARQVAELSRSELTEQSLESFGCLIRAANLDEVASKSPTPSPPSTCTWPPTTPPTCCPGSPRPGRCSSATTRRWPWAITRPVPRTCCPPAARLAGPAACRANDFFRSSSVIEFAAEGFAEMAPHVARLAELEGLTAHRASVDIRSRG